MTDVELARHIAETAGKLLLDLQRSGLFEGKALGKAGDRVANAFIMEALRSRRPDDAILSEEEKDDPERLAAVLTRQAELKALTRKYAADVDGVIH